MTGAGRTGTPTVACPTCGRPVDWTKDSPERPFCSRRCRLIDLGEWLEGSRAIPGEDAEGIDSGTGGDAPGESH
ncbi:MAG: DNA gyrase inhibitor YacG [Gammaproteobacteria bacterium]|nr:DNA gyrase inhibitor YacG [Gammaproteobacteria bacterium]